MLTPTPVPSPAVLRCHCSHLLPGAGRGCACLLIPGLGEGSVPGVL